MTAYSDLIVRRSLGETISELTYGVHKDEQGNDYVVKQEELLLYSTLASAGYLVDILPIRESGYRLAL